MAASSQMVYETFLLIAFLLLWRGPHLSTTQSCPWVFHHTWQGSFEYTLLNHFNSIFLSFTALCFVVGSTFWCMHYISYIFQVFDSPCEWISLMFLFNVVWTILASIWSLFLSLVNLYCLDPMSHYFCCPPCFAPSGFFLSLYHGSWFCLFFSNM